MANVIKILSSITPGAVPAALADGEIAINRADGKIFWKNSVGVIKSKSLTDPTISILTQAAYDAIVTKDANTLYFTHD